MAAEKKAQWESWKDSLSALEELQIPRPYLSVSLLCTQYRELFSDAFASVISAVAYHRAVDHEGHVQVGFCMDKSKLAPQASHTIPRLELCAAVLAIKLADILLMNWM